MIVPSHRGCLPFSCGEAQTQSPGAIWTLLSPSGKRLDDVIIQRHRLARGFHLARSNHAIDHRAHDMNPLPDKVQILPFEAAQFTSSYASKSSTDNHCPLA